MKTPNTNTVVFDLTGPDDEDQALRALTSVNIDDEEMPRYQAVDEFSDEFLMQAPRSSRRANLTPACRRQRNRGQTL
jgi:hypothetical protein